MKILDIGANEGSFLKNYCSENDIGVAVEPNPKFNLKSSNIFWEQKAVSNISEENVNLFLGVADTVSSLNIKWLTSGRFAGYYSNNTLQVKTVTIDNLVKKYGIFDHIKMDVEGYEDIAILGMTKNYNSVIQFEWANEWFESVTMNVLNYLKTLNYNKFCVTYYGTRDFDPKNLPTEYKTYDELLDIISRQRSINSDAWGMILATN